MDGWLLRLTWPEIIIMSELLVDEGLRLADPDHVCDPLREADMARLSVKLRHVLDRAPLSAPAEPAVAPECADTDTLGVAGRARLRLITGGAP